MKKNSSNMQAQGRLLRWQLWFNQFSFIIEHVQGWKNSMIDNLMCKLGDGDHHSRTPVEKEGNPN